MTLLKVVLSNYKYLLMNLYEQHPYWLMKDGIVAQYPSLDKDLSIDIAIIGAGISAALNAWHLRDVVLSYQSLWRIRLINRGETTLFQIIN